MTHREFFQTIVDLARGEPRVNPYGTAAHASVESRYGQSELGLKHRNLWGVKATSGWGGKVAMMPTWEVVKGERVDVMAAFRAYDSWAHAIEDYAGIIERVYPSARRFAASPVGFLAGLFLTGPSKWATDPNAFHKSLGVLDAFDAVAPTESLVRLGEHELWVDNSPTLAKGMVTIAAALKREPAVHRERVRATRTRREGGWKLDLARVTE